MKLKIEKILRLHGSAAATAPKVGNDEPPAVRETDKPLAFSGA